MNECYSNHAVLFACLELHGKEEVRERERERGREREQREREKERESTID